ncbi:MAG: helix-turn-helix transcriptional regulator [Clostridia bacterium]|nr:helix-turn-helix transcriptional regulator [Clostridia bacterium]
MDATKTGALIGALRKEQGLTQTALANQLQVSNRTVSKWENGDGYPDVTMLPLLAEALGVTVDELLRGERDETSADLKVTAVKNKDDVYNLFQIAFLIALFCEGFGTLLCLVTELYSVWAFDILFYTHWEIVFVAASFAAAALGGLIFCVGAVRLRPAFSKKERRPLIAKKAWIIGVVGAGMPLSFLYRLITCFLLPNALVVGIALLLVYAAASVLLYRFAIRRED